MSKFWQWLFGYKVVEITGCQSSEAGFCPAEYDGHCMLEVVDTPYDGSIPPNCPLRKSPRLLKLKDSKK